MARSPSGLLQVVVLIGIGALFYLKGLPWIRANFTRSEPRQASGGGSTYESSCVDRAERVNLAFGSRIGSFVRQSEDTSGWTGFRAGIDQQIAEATTACSCSAQSCEKARKALENLRGVVAELNGAIRGASSPGSGLVLQLEDIEQMLDQARELAASGN